MKNKRLKKEFAKAFGWYERVQEYGYSSFSRVKYREDASWEEIFTEIGRLKERANRSERDVCTIDSDMRINHG